MINKDVTLWNPHNFLGTINYNGVFFYGKNTIATFEGWMHLNGSKNNGYNVQNLVKRLKHFVIPKSILRYHRKCWSIKVGRSGHVKITQENPFWGRFLVQLRSCTMKTSVKKLEDEQRRSRAVVGWRVIVYAVLQSNLSPGGLLSAGVGRRAVAPCPRHIITQTAQSP